MEDKEIKASLYLTLAAAVKYDSIAHELVRARKALGWSQSQLHEQTGISREVIAMYETGRNKPGAREIVRLCEALKISPNKLLIGNDEYIPSTTPIRRGLTDTEAREVKKQMRLIVLLSMLTVEERNAMLTLIESIIIGRDGGEDKIRKKFIGIDAMSDDLISVVDQLVGEWADFKVKTGLHEEIESRTRRKRETTTKTKEPKVKKT
jgi:transcriptional regulator with XRE-family HTH domain